MLVDADLRHHYLHHYFQIKSDPGLTNLIFDEELDQPEVMHKTDYENLTALPSGPIPPNPAEMLDLMRMKNLVGQFGLEYDYVIIDSPPVIAVTDAAILSGLVDGVLFLLDYGRVKWEEAEMPYPKANLTIKATSITTGPVLFHGANGGKSAKRINMINTK